MDAELERWRLPASGSTTWALTSSTGSGLRPALLLIHGYPFQLMDWAAIWDRLTTRFTVIAPDMMGMGFSAKPAAYEYRCPTTQTCMRHRWLISVSGRCVLSHDVGDSVAQNRWPVWSSAITGTRPEHQKRSRG